MNIDKYLYEIIEDYKNADSKKEQSVIFKDFCSSVWKNKNKRRTYTKSVKFRVRTDLLETDIGQVFNTWSTVDYIGYKTMTKDTDWCSLLRQKANNLFTKYCDKEVILNKNYMALLNTPKKIYYRWLNGEQINADELTEMIECSIYQADELKSICQKQKMDLTWDKYKRVIEKFLRKIFDNCKLIEDYEVEHITNNLIYDFYNEDNFYIKYICDSLECYMLNYQKEHYELKRGRNKRYKHCEECGRLIEDKSKTHPVTYCKKCKDKHRKSTYKKYNEKRNKKITTLSFSTTQP